MLCENFLEVMAFGVGKAPCAATGALADGEGADDAEVDGGQPRGGRTIEVRQCRGAILGHGGERPAGWTISADWTWIDPRWGLTVEEGVVRGGGDAAAEAAE